MRTTLVRDDVNTLKCTSSILCHFYMLMRGIKFLMNFNILVTKEIMQKFKKQRWVCSTLYVLTCSADYCAKCCDINHVPKVMAKHVCFPIEAKGTTVATLLCSIHGEKMRLFCVNSSCRTAVCVLCSSHGDHKGHECKVCA